MATNEEQPENLFVFAPVNRSHTEGLTFEASRLKHNSRLRTGPTLKHILADRGIPVATTCSPACAECCSGRIIGLDNAQLLTEGQDLQAQAATGTEEGVEKRQEAIEKANYGPGFISYGFILASVLTT